MPNRSHIVYNKISNKKLKEKGTLICPECFSILSHHDSRLRTGFHWCCHCKAEFMYDEVLKNPKKGY